MNDTGVVQFQGSLDLPTEGDSGVVSIDLLTNTDLDNDTGDAWFPDGHAGKFTEIDLTVAYSQVVNDVVLTGGVITYVLPNGTEFVTSPALSERGETKELFLRAETDINGLTASAILHYDIDEVNGFYFNAEALKSFAVKDDMSAEIAVSLGANDDRHAEWTYGVPDGGGGLADAAIRARLDYALNERSTLFGSLGYSQILGGDIEDWMDTIGIDTSVVWLVLGSTWSL